MNARVLMLVTVLMIASAEESSAQMFSPLQSIRSNTLLQNAVGLSGDRRFLRQNRRADDFIGRDVDAGQGFVGDTRGRTEGRVPPATLTLREEPVVNVNQPLPPPTRTGLYPPRLTLGFEVTEPTPATTTRELESRLSRSLGTQFGDAIVVEVNGSTATLSGEVASQNQRELAALMAGFEPGVRQVRNDLIVRRSPTPAPPIPQAP